MQDLNDLYYFVQVVAHGGFAAAGRVLGIQKSKLSRRVAALEERLGARLIQRSTRQFSVTELGQEYYRQCVVMLTAAEEAQAIIDNVKSEPQGLVRIACPPGLLAIIFGDSIAAFMSKYSLVEIQLKAFNRPVDLISEGYDVVLQSGSPIAQQGSIITRKLGEISHCLVASPQLLECHAALQAPTELASLPSIDFGIAGIDGQQQRRWILQHGDGSTATVLHRPKFVADDLSSLLSAARVGIGIAELPSLLVDADVADGRLVEALPNWRPRNDVVYAAFPSRRGLLPSIRMLLDFLAQQCLPFRDGTRARVK